MFSRLNVLNVFSIYYIFNLRWVYWDITPSQGFPGGSVVKNPPANAGDVGWIPGLGRSPGRGNGNPTSVFFLRNHMDRGAWRVGHDLMTEQQQQQTEPF